MDKIYVMSKLEKKTRIPFTGAIFTYQSASIGLKRMNEVYTDGIDEKRSVDAILSNGQSIFGAYPGIELWNVCFGYND